ncbi:MAG: hypothetical protein IJ296_02455 [Bacteroidales bacterium]|nr:hypothetical protein [Bacteroidales bacterium]
MEELQFYDNFEKALEQDMLKVCTSAGMLDGVMLASDDIDQKWNDYANSYMADAIEQINEYPEVAIAWSLYMGMAVAQWWDVDWLQNKDNEYLKLYGLHGFDDMDDYIVEQILGEKLGTEAADKISSTAYSCAQRAISMIRKENIEFGSVKAFYVLSRTVKVMYRIGAALQLKRLGYKFEKLGN